MSILQVVRGGCITPTTSWAPIAFILASSHCTTRSGHSRCLGRNAEAYGFQYRTYHRSLDENRSVAASGLPVQVDLLERYRAHVALGTIEYDEEQVRVVMQLRRLERELRGYVPPSVVSGLLRRSDSTRDRSSKDFTPWWTYSPEEEPDVDSKALVRMKSNAEELASLETPEGLLLTGPPGAGKSFLVDMWYAALPTRFKARKHYSQLVLEIYRAVWEETQRRMAAARAESRDVHQHEEAERTPWNKAIRDRWRGLLRTGKVPIRWGRRNVMRPQETDPAMAFTIARRLVLRHWLLVFDEVQLLDVSSAILLADVLSWYWRLGGVVVGTSNKVPDDLYRNGVQRERLEPFVEALKARCPVLVMRSEKDWRQENSGTGEGRSWFVGKEGRTGFEKAFQRLVAPRSGEGAQPSHRELNVFGRSLSIQCCSADTCKFTFAELFNETLGPADYLTLASNFRTIVITDIPVLKLADKDQARRFIAFIDAVYESRCRLLGLADAEPEEMFFPDAVLSHHPREEDVMMAESVMETQERYRPNVSSYDSPGMADAPATPALKVPLETLSIFSGQDEQFAFKRALSRLIEVTSAGYGQRPLDEWTPWASSVRKWETPTQALGGRVPATTPSAATDRSGQLDDFVEEEPAHENLEQTLKRPHPPRLSPDHVWGVRDDWGPGAGAWGRGFKS